MARKLLLAESACLALPSRNESGELARIAPGTAKELLDQGLPIEVVTRVGSESESKGSSFSATARNENFWISDDVYRSNSSTRSSTQRVSYTSSPLTAWDSVLWMDDEDARGVPGTPKLPASGRPVTVSSEWESSWAKSSAEHHGFLLEKSDHRADSGYQRVSQRSDG